MRYGDDFSFIRKMVEDDILQNAQKQANGGTAEALQAESDANSMNIMAKDAPPVDVPLARAGVGEGATVKPGRTGSYVAVDGPRDAGSNPAAAGGSLATQDDDELAKAKERYANAYKASNDAFRNASIMQGGVQIGRALAGMPIEKQINRSYVDDATKRFGTPDALRSQEEAVIKDILARKQAAKQFGDQMALSKDQFGQKMALDRDQMRQAKAIADEQLKVQMANAKTQQDQLQAQINHQNVMEKIGWYQAKTGRINATETKDAAKQLKDQENLEKGVQALMKEIPSEAATLTQQLGVLGEFEGRSDIPGQGAIEGWVPDRFSGSEGLKFRQAAKGAVGTLLKLQSGQTVKEEERENKLKELGLSDTASPEQFNNGLKNLRAQLGAVLQQKYAGFRPEVQEVYKSRGGISPDSFSRSAALPGQQSQTAAPSINSLPKPSDGSVWMLFPDGVQRQVHFSKLIEAQKDGATVIGGGANGGQ